MEKVNTLEQTKEANKMTKKLTIMVALAMCAVAAFARPHGGFGGPRGGFGGPRGGFGMRPAPMMHHGPAPIHHHSGWGHGGRGFWPAAVGGFVGGVISSSIIGPSVYTTPVVTTPVYSTPVVTTPVYTAPVYTTQQVWVPSTYVDQIQPNGTVIRVWQPGHYESRQVLVQ